MDYLTNETSGTAEVSGITQMTTNLVQKYWPVVGPAVEFVLDNYLLITGFILFVMWWRWNQSTMMLNGGWHGLGRDAPKKRLSKDTLPPYPNGWYKILDDHEIKKEKVVSVNLCGKKMVAFRTKEGKVGVLDAYCPHLGADLGVHGRVVDGCVECPFHAWRFNPDGECEGIQYSDTIPKDASIQAYDCIERNKKIYVWFHADNEPPKWEPPAYEKIENGEWYLAAWSGHEVLTHIAEIPENGPDVAHLNVLHKHWIYGGDLHKTGGSVVKHVWDATWKVNEDKPYSSSMTVQMDIEIGPFSPFLPSLTRVPVTAWQVGPGLVFLHLHTPFGLMLMSQNCTPVGQLRNRVEHYYYAEKRVPRMIAKIIALGASRQFQRYGFNFNNYNTLI